MVMAKSEDHGSMRIAFPDPDFKSAWGTLLARVGMSQQDVVTRALGWLMDQDEGVQSMVLRTIPEKYEGQVAKLVLERIAAEPGKKKKWYPKYDKLVSDERTATKHRQ
jgi:hypothetical protein